MGFFVGVKVSNIIKFPEKESVSYSQYEGKMTGVYGTFNCETPDIEMQQITAELFSLEIGGEYVSGTRKQVAQFLWAAAYFLDSNQEWAESEYPALNK